MEVGESCCLVYIILPVLLCLLSLFYLLTRWTGSSGEGDSPGKGVAVLHCPPPGMHAPSISPFVIKIMTFLRYMDIPYKLDHKTVLGPKGKTPWVTLEGETIEDSEVIIATLTQRYHRSEDLSPLHQALSTSLSAMLDHRFAWCLRVFRYKWDNGREFREQRGMPWWYYVVGVPFLCWRISTGLWHHGMGRHDRETVIQFLREDLNAINGCLGDKPYLLGMEPAIIDVKVFSHLVNLVYNYRRSPFYSIIKDEFPALMSYVKRMKEKYWSDWDDCLYKDP